MAAVAAPFVRCGNRGGADDLVPPQPLAPLRASGAVVGEGPLEADGLDAGVEAPLADVEAGDYRGAGFLSS